MPFTGRHVQRRREVIDHGVEQELHALVLQRRAAEHGHQAQVDGGAAQGSLQLVVGDLLALQVAQGQLIVALDDKLDHLLALGGDFVDHIGGNIGLLDVRCRCLQCG